MLWSRRVGYPLSKPKISPEEMERRREALRRADASNRIEGVYRDPESASVFDAFLRGEIELNQIIPHLKALGPQH